MQVLAVNDEHRLELRDIPKPRLAPFTALVKIKACGICSTTDSEIIRGTQPYHKGYPCLLGHEAVGEVIDVGEGVTKFRPGDWVTRPVGIWPGTSRDGLISGWGGFAEYGIVRDGEAMARAGDPSMRDDYTAVRQNVIPARVDAATAVLSISLAETFSWSRNLPSLEGKQVCIAGTGIAGLSLVIWSKLLGAKKVIVLGRRDERLQLGSALGADHGVNVQAHDTIAAVREASGGGVDIFLEAAGQKDQLHVGCSVIRSGGTIAVYGAPPKGFYELQYSWLPSDVRLMRPSADEHMAYADVLSLLQAGKVPIEKLMTHRWPLSEYASAFAAISAGEVVKGMLVMPS